MFEVKRVTIKKFELLEISGKLVTAEAYKLEERVESIMNESTATNFIFNLQNLDYCSSYGLRTFIKTKKDLMLYDGKVILFSPSKSFSNLLELAGLESLFIIENNWNNIINELAV